MSQGFMPSYNDDKQEQIKEMAVTPACDLADKIEDEVIPSSG
jgi:hypothetical protein